MELYIGGLAQGKLNYVLNHLKHMENPIICDGATATEAELYKANIINHFHLFIQKQLQASQNVDMLPHKLLLKNPYVTIICNEVGSGVVPMEKADRIYREKVGRICHELAKRSQKVVRIQCGLGTVLKDNKNTILCCFIRHGKTTGNLSKRYIGTTNEPLCPEGITALKELHAQDIYPKVDLLYASPMLRCIETAKLLYPSKAYKLCEVLRECDFGEFENKNYKELQGNANYQKWIDSNGTIPFPNGEDPNAFTQRCVKGFLSSINQAIDDYHTSFSQPSGWTTFVVHGGTIMSVLSELSSPKGDYFSFQIDNGQGYLCEYHIATQTLTILDAI